MSIFTVIFDKRRRHQSARFEIMQQLAHVQPTFIYEDIVIRGRRQFQVQTLATDTGFYKAEQSVYSDVKSTVLMSGYAYSYDKEEPRLLDAADLSEITLSQFDDLAGEYAICRIDGDGRLLAFADPDGLQNIFYVNTRDIFAVSTRPAILAAIAGNRNIDLHSLAWISAIGYRVGERTGYSDVKAIPQGTALVWDGTLSFIDRVTPLNRDHADGLSVKPRWFEDHLERGIAAAGRAVQLACLDKDTIDLAITGGKDSRLVLALCLAAGLRDRITLYTNGPSDHPDVIVGKMVAKAIDVPHQTRRSAPISQSFIDAPHYLGRTAAFAYQADGLTGSWDNCVTSRSAQNIHMSGNMGEVLKGNAKKPINPDAIDPIARITFQSTFDPMGILKPSARQSLVDDLANRGSKWRAMNFSAEDFPDLFYYSSRVWNWLGGFRQIHPFAIETVMPIGVPPLMRMAFVATAHERKIEKIHYEIIRRLAPALVGIPFALQKWHPDLGATDIIPLNVQSGSTTPVHGSWQYSLNQDIKIRDEIIRLISETAASQFWNIIDADKLIARLRGSAMEMKEIVSLLGILPSLMFATEKFCPTKIEAQNSPFPQVPYAWPKVKTRRILPSWITFKAA